MPPDDDHTNSTDDRPDGSGRECAGEVPDIFPTQYRSAEDAAGVAALAEA